MKLLAILACKLASWAGKKLGRGSSLPGSIALKLDRKILTKLKLPETVVAVTGSNGKTTTTGMIYDALVKSGKRVVCNVEGSNQLEGVATALLNAATLGGVVRADVVLLESDERFAQYTLPQIKPSHLLVTNLFRDQLTRNSHAEFVYGELAKALLPETRLILNADDPLVCLLGEGRESVGFGVETPAYADPFGPGVYDDGARCPRCKAPMTYSRRVYAHLGDYACGRCGYRRQAPAYAVTGREGAYAVLNGQYRAKPYLDLDNLSAVYNLTAAFAALSEIGLPPEQSAQALSGFQDQKGRIREFSVGERRGIFLLSKHENSTAYNQALQYIAQLEEDCSVAVLINSISRKYVANDVSWIWDIDFERLARPHIKKVFVAGKFAYDLANRLSYTGVEEDRLTVEPDVDALVARLGQEGVGKLVLLTCFSDIGTFERALERGNKQ